MTAADDVTPAPTSTDGQSVDLVQLAARAGIDSRHLTPYGRDVAKIELTALQADPEAEQEDTEPAHYVVVTAITPTSFGEVKSTVAVGLSQGLASTMRVAKVQ